MDYKSEWAEPQRLVCAVVKVVYINRGDYSLKQKEKGKEEYLYSAFLH